MKPAEPGRRLDPALWLVPRLAALVIRGLRRTMRLRHVDREPLEALEQQGRPCILAFWHGRLLLMPYCTPRRDVVILISRHRDGELIARTMQRFGHRVVRGSSSRGATAALKALVRELRSGAAAAVTPDGPRGPRHRVQPGVIQAARLSGVPIVPIGFGAAPVKELSSWDRFLLPLPFSRGVFVYGSPFHVPGDAGPPEVERWRHHLEDTLDSLTLRAGRLAHGGGGRGEMGS